MTRGPTKRPSPPPAKSYWPNTIMLLAITLLTGVSILGFVEIHGLAGWPRDLKLIGSVVIVVVGLAAMESVYSRGRKDFEGDEGDEA